MTAAKKPRDLSGDRAMILLPFSAGRVAWMAVPLACLVTVSYLVNPESWQAADWWVYAVLGLFFLMVLAVPPLMASRCRLKLDADGIHVKMLFREETYLWRDIEGFVTAGLDHGPVPMVRFVGVNFRTAPPKLPSFLAAMMQRVNGYHRSLPAWFGGLDAERLASLLERSRREHLALPMGENGPV